MNYNWNWRIFWEPSPDGIGTYMDTLWSGLAWTLATALTAWIMALILGAIVGTVRTMPGKWAQRIANGYVELFRNVPLLVQMFLWYFVMPELVPQALGDWLKALPNAPFITAVLCLGFFTSSRVAVQVSAGIHSLPRGQKMAGTALGLVLPLIVTSALDLRPFVGGDTQPRAAIDPLWVLAAVGAFALVVVVAGAVAGMLGRRFAPAGTLKMGEG